MNENQAANGEAAHLDSDGDDNSLQEIVPDGDAEQDVTRVGRDPATCGRLEDDVSPTGTSCNALFLFPFLAQKKKDHFKGRRSFQPEFERSILMGGGGASITVLHQRWTGDVVHLAATGSIVSKGKRSCYELAVGHPKKGSSPLPM